CRMRVAPRPGGGTEIARRQPRAWLGRVGSGERAKEGVVVARGRADGPIANHVLDDQRIHAGRRARWLGDLRRNGRTTNRERLDRGEQRRKPWAPNLRSEAGWSRAHPGARDGDRRPAAGSAEGARSLRSVLLDLAGPERGAADAVPDPVSSHATRAHLIRDGYALHSLLRKRHTQ